RSSDLLRPGGRPVRDRTGADQQAVNGRLEAVTETPGSREPGVLFMWKGPPEKAPSTQPETPQPIPIPIHLQRPAILVPVPQNNPLCSLASHLQRMHCRAVGVAVDKGGGPVFAHYPGHLVLVDVGDVQRLVASTLLAFVAQLASDAVAGLQGQVAQDEQACRVAQPAAHAHVAGIIDTQTVSVHPQYPLAVQPDDGRVAEQGAAGAAAEVPADEKVPVAMHDIYGSAGARQGEQGRADLVCQRVGVVVPEPDFKEVAQYVESASSVGTLLEKTQKRPGDVRALRFKMQIRDEQTAHLQVLL